MWYCFIRQDLENIADDDPLMIQSAYAKAIDAFCVLDLSTGNVLDQRDQPVSLWGKRVFLRGSCDFVPKALRFLQSGGCDMLETEDDIRKVLHWELLRQVKRKIISLRAGDILSGRIPDYARTMLEENEAVFVKSREKGFSAKIASDRLLSQDPAVMAVIAEHCAPEADVLVSELMNIKRDSLGKKESRHFVINNQIRSSSRPIHSIMHTVPKTLLREAKSIVEQIARNEDFPDNYVIDIGLIEKNGEAMADIIEINPIGSAMCYVNNSIFAEALPGAEQEENKLSYGREYQLDMARNPHRYRANRSSGEQFGYCSAEQYEFL